MSSTGWRLIRAGSGQGAVLCLNFTVAGAKAQASFADLAPQLPPGYAVWGTDEAAWPTTPVPPEAQLEQWLDHSVAVAAPVRAVFGFCGTAALAAVLADRLADHGAPAVVLFDPIVVGSQNMIDQTTDSLRQLAGGEAPALGGDLPTADLGTLATVLRQRYAQRAETVGAAKSIRASTVAQLCDRLEGYLRYLALCATAWSSRRVAPDLVVLSRDYDVPPELAGTPLARLAVTQHTLLAQPEAAEAAARVLAGVLVDGRS